MFSICRKAEWQKLVFQMGPDPRRGSLKRRRAKHRFQHLLHKLRAHPFPADGKQGEQGHPGSTRDLNPSLDWLPAFSNPPWAPGNFLIPKMLTFCKIQYASSSSPCPPSAAGALRGRNWFQGGWQEGTGVVEDLATHQLDNQLMKGRVRYALGLDLVSAALPYLTRQLATASP